MRRRGVVLAWGVRAMTFAAFAVLAATAAPAQLPEPPPPVRVVGKRLLSVGVEFKPDKLEKLNEARLFVSRDGGGQYDIGDRITMTDGKPSAPAFSYTAKEDGEYWVQMQLVYKDGAVVPKNPSVIPPAEKVIVDTVKPVVVLTLAEQSGDEVNLEWRIDDRNPADESTRVFYKAAGPGEGWKEPSAGSVSKRTCRFKPDVAGAITVQVVTMDLAKNIGHTNRDVGGRGPVVPAGKSDPIPPSKPDMRSDVPAPPTGLGGGSREPFNPSEDLPRPKFDTQPKFEPPPPPIAPAPAVTPEPPRPEAARPLLASSNYPTAAPPPTAAAEAAPAQMSRSPRFELNYTLDSGASGVARVDLYVTRDEGRSWVRWSQHDGRETPLKVVLDTRFNKEVEGDYGFALVPVSGAGLSEGAPTAGTAPELKVRVDTTAPVIKVFAPTADPNNKAALVLNWEATDKNFGRDPIAIEYAESAQGPWKSVTGTDGPAAARVENNGQYSWQPPLNLTTPKVYLRFSAWDQAGNKNEVVTPNPILVDLTKPKARIQGITAK